MHYKCCRECRTTYRIGLFEDFGTCDPRSYVCKMCAGAMADLPDTHPLWAKAGVAAMMGYHKAIAPVWWEIKHGAD